MPAAGAFTAGLALALAGAVLFSAKAILVKLSYRYGVDAVTLIALQMAPVAPHFTLAFGPASRRAPPLSRLAQPAPVHCLAGAFVSSPEGMAASRRAPAD